MNDAIYMRPIGFGAKNREITEGIILEKLVARA